MWWGDLQHNCEWHYLITPPTSPTFVYLLSPHQLNSSSTDTCLVACSLPSLICSHCHPATWSLIPAPQLKSLLCSWSHWNAITYPPLLNLTYHHYPPSNSAPPSLTHHCYLPSHTPPASYFFLKIKDLPSSCNCRLKFPMLPTVRLPWVSEQHMVRSHPGFLLV